MRQLVVGVHQLLMTPRPRRPGGRRGAPRLRLARAMLAPKAGASGGGIGRNVFAVFSGGCSNIRGQAWKYLPATRNQTPTSHIPQHQARDLPLPSVLPARRSANYCVYLEIVLTPATFTCSRFACCNVPRPRARSSSTECLPRRLFGCAKCAQPRQRRFWGYYSIKKPGKQKIL